MDAQTLETQQNDTEKQYEAIGKQIASLHDEQMRLQGQYRFINSVLATTATIQENDPDSAATSIVAPGIPEPATETKIEVTDGGTTDGTPSTE